ncbi:tetratricopeptide repeat protein 6 [Microcaecilia unicolor]|uniref:Tetratricopeptide repeat protein 6 n=1 Tax=Microcaecilia unicolor TaxID=1415580 RepID=A0A6P7YYD3_9AMPH|nr:tetratricopeptide repeat protein 6 [Microcaecilia unicolor]
MVSHQFIHIPECPVPLIGRDLLCKLQATLKFKPTGEVEAHFEDQPVTLLCPVREEWRLYAPLIAGPNDSCYYQDTPFAQQRRDLMEEVPNKQMEHRQQDFPGCRSYKNMAGKQKPLPVGLNYSQEQKMKKELERLHKQSQKDSFYFKDSVNATGIQPFSTDLTSDQSSPLHSLTLQMPTAVCKPVSNMTNTFGKEHDSTRNVDKEERVCSSSRQEGLDHEVATKGTKSSLRNEMKSKSAVRKQGKYLEFKLLTKDDSNNEFKGGRKPAIASFAGTIKTAIVLPRPEPPVKQRPYKSTVQPRERSQQTLSLPQRKKINAEREEIFYSSSKTISTTERVSSENEEHNESHFLAFDSMMNRDHQQQIKEASQKYKKEMTMDKEQLITAEQALAVEKKSKEMKGSTSFGKPSNANPQAEETSETSVVCREDLEQRQPEALSSPEPALRVTARSLSEIVASLRSPGTTDLHASDYVVKELMERVLGQSYSFHRDETELSVESSSIEKEPLAKQKLPSADQQADQETELSFESSSIEKEPLAKQKLPSADQQADQETELSVETTAIEKEPLAKQKLPSADQQADQILKLVVPDQASPENFLVNVPCQTPVESAHLKRPVSSAVSMPPKLAVGTPNVAKDTKVSDSLNVKGKAVLIKPLERFGKTSDKKSPRYQPVSLLATWTQKNKGPQRLIIHHLCMASFSYVLPSSFQLASRVLHTVDKYDHRVTSELQNLDIRTWNSRERSRILHQGIHVSELLEHNLKDGIQVLPPQKPKGIAEWQSLAEYCVERPQLQLLGEKVPLQARALKMFWTPAPPKFYAPLSLVKEALFPEYKSSSVDPGVYEVFLSSLGEDTLEDELMYLNEVDIVTKILSRKYSSMSDMRSSIPDSLSAAEDLKTSAMKKSVSSTELPDYSENVLMLPSDFQTSMTELEILKQKLTQAKDLTVPESISPGLYTEIKTEESSPPKLSKQEHTKEMLLAEAVRKAGSKCIVLPPKKRRRESLKKIGSQNLKMVMEQLHQPARILKSSLSWEKLNIRSDDTFQFPEMPRHYRYPSLPLLLDFKTFAENRGGIPEGFVVREWVRDIWNTWFDEVFPPSRPSTSEKHEVMDKDKVRSQEQEEDMQRIDYVKRLDSVSPVLVDSSLSVEDLQREVDRLTELIDLKGETSVFNYYRRGALNRKLGKLKEALIDLNKAISDEPMLLDAYWHRHLIFLLQGLTEDALDDLNFITKYNKNRADAYMSMAEIYKSRGDDTTAILNYNQAIRCKPRDDDIYFRRAEVYERKNEELLAMNDYVHCFTLNPRRTDALMRHGIYYFENSNWNMAISDFTAVIQQNPNHGQARTYRGRAYLNQSFFKRAVEDLCAAIHLEPLNWTAFYYRGCLLRKSYPFRALQDLSVSVLINDGPENWKAFLHRGIVYTDLKKWSEAICDFETVIALDRSIAVAYVNIGLIFLLQMDQYFKAIKKFTDAIKANPVYVRAYICRAQAYHKVHDLKNALKDITRAIHLQPDGQHLNVLRAQYLYEMKKCELASFCIHYAAEMSEGSSTIQKALAQAFHQDYSASTETLRIESHVNPSPDKFTLLGKTLMKAKNITEAIESFKSALNMLHPLKPNNSSSTEAAEIFYFLGLCYMEEVSLFKAIVAFTDAIKILPDFADAYYQRGMCRMRLQQDVCIVDFNQTLEINPNFFQACLSRAVYYGSKGRYIKAILSCNEAIKIQPDCVRAYIYRGALKYYIKAYCRAIDDLTKAIEMDKTCSLAYFNRAVCYHQMKIYDKALKDYGIGLLLDDFKDAILYNPHDSKIHQMTAVCYHRLCQFEEAVNEHNQVLKSDPMFLEAYVARGNSYMEYSDPRGIKLAQRDFQRAVHLNPLYIKARICLGYSLQIEGKFQKAWHQFTVLLDLDPKCYLGYEARALVNLQMGDTFAAFQDISAALKLITTAELLTNRGIINQFMGHLPNAMKDYQAAIVLNPSYPLAYFNAANMYFSNRQFSQAKDYYSKALNLDPTNESVLLNRAITNTLLQNVHEALEDFEKAISVSPLSAIIYFNKANLHSTLQQYKQADQDFSKALQLQPNDALTYKLRADVRGKMGFVEEAISDYKCAVKLQQTVEINA